MWKWLKKLRGQRVPEQLFSLVDLVAEVAIKNSERQATAFEAALARQCGMRLDADTTEHILALFVCANWAAANGVWSHLPQAALRRDLLVQSKTAMLTRLAAELQPTGPNEAVALRAASVDFEIFQPFVAGYQRRIAYAGQNGMPVDETLALTFVLETVQFILKLDEERMYQVVTHFMPAAGGFSDVEGVAGQVNRAAGVEA